MTTEILINTEIPTFRTALNDVIRCTDTNLFNVCDDAMLCADVELLDVLNEGFFAITLHRAAQHQQQRRAQLVMRQL